MDGGRKGWFEGPGDASGGPRLADPDGGTTIGPSAGTDAAEADGVSRRAAGWILALAGLLAAATVLLSSCGGGAGSAGSGRGAAPPGEETRSAGRAVGVSVADVTDNPDEFYGKELTLSGLVTEKVGPHSIAIGGDDAFAGEPVLVVGAEEKLGKMAEGLPDSEVAEFRQRDLAQVTGTLREFGVKEIEERIGYELDEGVLGRWEGAPVLLAEKVVLTPRQDGDAARQGVDATLPLIADAPEEFYGQSVTVEGVVARIVNRNVFLIVDERVARQGEIFDDVDSTDTLVKRGVLVATSEGPAPAEKQAVRVTGRVERFEVTDLERRLGADFEEDAEVLSTYQGNEGPALLASEVRRLARGGETNGGETTSR